MNTNQQGFDIEAMLQKLDQEEQKTPDQEIGAGVSEEHTEDSLQDLGDKKNSTTETKRTKKFSLNLSSRMRSVLSLVTTFVFIIIALWVLSVQYPEETKNIKGGVANTFSSIVATVNNNQLPQEITMTTGNNADYVTGSPLADALDDSNTLSGTSKADDLFADLGGDVSASGDNAIEFTDKESSLTGDVSSTGDQDSGIEEPESNYIPDYDLPDVDLPTWTVFMNQVNELMKSSKNAHANYLGNSPSDKSILSTVYKSTQDIIKSLAQSRETTREDYDRYQTMKTMYEGVMQ